MKKRWSICIVLLAFVFVIAIASLSYTTVHVKADSGTDYSAYSATSTFVINTSADFESFATFYNNKSMYNFSNKTVVLNCDINLATTPMKFDTFLGTFEGNGHKVYNQEQPLFSYLGSKDIASVVKNINFVNAKNTEKSYLLSQTNYGLIENVNYWGNFVAVNSGQVQIFYGIVESNFNTMQNCANFGKITGTKSSTIVGIAKNNYGKMLQCSFLGDININMTADINNSIALIAYNNFVQNNTVYPAVDSDGEITNCTAYVNVFFNSQVTITKNSTILMLFENHGTVSSTNTVTKTIRNNMPLDKITTGFLLNSHGRSEVVNSYYVIENDGGIFDSDGTFADLDEIWQTTLGADSVGQQFFYYQDIYPINKQLFGFDGVIKQLHIVELADMFKLRCFYGQGSIGGKIYADQNMDKLFAVSAVVDNEVEFNINGQNFAFYNSQNAYIFDANVDIAVQNVGNLASSTAVKIAQNNADGSSVYYDNSGFDYNLQASTEQITAATNLQGDGTRVSPYLIGTAEELVALDGVFGYALLTSDIVINDGSLPTKLLPDITLNVTFFGGGHSIVGVLNNSLFGINNGSISNLFVRGYINENASSLVCQTNNGKLTNITVSGSISNQQGGLVCYENNNDITNITTFGTVDGDTTAGLVVDNKGSITKSQNYAYVLSIADTASGISNSNTGSITLCQNFGDANFGISAQQNGTVANTINFANSAFADKVLGISTSINIDSINEYYYLISANNMAMYQKLDYLTVKSFGGYDLANVFGYQVGTFLPYPVLREVGKSYKTELANAFRNYNFGTKTYNSGVSYLVEDIELYVKNTAESATMSWQYNGANFFDSEFSEAGTYTLTANYLGSANYLPSRSVQTFVINKAVPPTTINYQNFVNISVVYSGEVFALEPISPENYAELVGYGYSESITYSLQGTVIFSDEIILPNTYKQTVKYSSKNYHDLVAERNIVIAKKSIVLTVGDSQIDYLQQIDWQNVDVGISGLVDKDKNKTIDMLVDNFTDYFSTNYTQSADIGQYYLGYTLEQTAHYIITVVNGSLTVNAIDLPQNDISFYFATASTNGYYQSNYNGMVQQLEASNTQGVVVSYQNNDSKNVGTYFVKATFSKQNYNDLVLTTVFEIKQIPLNITVQDAVFSYGYQIKSSDFGCATEDFVASDTMQNVFDMSTFVYSIWQNDQQMDIGGLLDAGTYQIRLAPLDTNNYAVAIFFGTLTINKISLQYLYNNNDAQNASSFDDYTYTYSGTEFVREITYFADNQISVDIVYEYKLSGNIIPTKYGINAGVYTITATVTPSGAVANNFVDTTYVCIMTIAKEQIDIEFSASEYTFNYDATNKALAENFDYIGTLPLDAKPNFSCQQNGQSTSAINVGTYLLVYTVEESDNYNAGVAYASLTILPKKVTVLVQSEYTYTSKAITMVATINGVINQEIDYSNLKFSYKNDKNNAVIAITTVGSYTATVEIKNNNNYYVDIDTFAITVKEYSLNFEWGELHYTYGQTGNFSYNGKNYTIASTLVTLKNYYVVALDTNIDIILNFVTQSAGSFVLSNANIVQIPNYNISFTPTSLAGGLNKIVVGYRPLNVIWKIDNIEYYNKTYENVYTGIAQRTRWTYWLDNFAFDHTENDLELVQTVVGESENILNVGVYIILLEIRNSDKYVLQEENESIKITIFKAQLNITINDATIEQGESYHSPLLTVLGRVGKDINKGVYDLDGSNIVMHTDYTTDKPINSVFDINITATFKNYQAEIVRVGKLTVVANPYPDYSLKDAVFVYDNSYKTVVIEHVDSNVSVQYLNNSHKDVGSYRVSAIITYPSGREKATSCTLTIIKATPTLHLQNAFFIYTPNRLLLSSDITGSASYKGQNVSGFLQFVGSWNLRLGSYDKYEIKFLPEDSQNYNEVNSYYTISSAEVDFSTLVFDSVNNFTFVSNDTAEITANVKISLKDTISGLKLYRNGSLVDSIILTKTEKLYLQVRYEQEIVLNYIWDIIFIDTNMPVIVEINESLLELSGVTIEGDKMMVHPMGGRIKLATEYADNYLLYVNGVQLDEYIINGYEENVVIIIKSKTAEDITFVSKEFGVETATTTDIEAPKRDYIIYFIVGGSILAVALFVAIFFIIRQRKL